MNEDGTMSRLPQLYDVAKKFNLKIVSIEDLIAYRMKNDNSIDKIFDKNIKTSFGSYRLRAFKQTNNNQVHIALTLGNWESNETILTRVNSSKMIVTLLKCLKGTNEIKYDEIFEKINNEEKGCNYFY